MANANYDIDYTIVRCENSSKYMLIIGNESVYSGTYTQCLIVLGALANQATLESGIKLAEQC